jgi:hypothetical protein
MKTQLEIQRAHDIMVAFLVGEMPVNIDREQRLILASSCSALCWVLGHDHNTQFSTLLSGLEETARIAGLTLQNTSN